MAGAMTLVTLDQITARAVTVESNAKLCADICKLRALDAREKLALAVYCRAKELANDGSSRVTGYEPDTAAYVAALVEDAKKFMGAIPAGDLMLASLAIDWNNCKSVAAGISADVDALRGKIQVLSQYSEDELRRMAIYLRLEIGE